MNVQVITSPTNEPVTLTEAKSHLRVDHEHEDTLIESLVTTARQYAESVLTRRAFVTQTLKVTLDEWPDDKLLLPRPPLQSVESITYYDEDGVSGTVDADDYIVDTSSEPGRIALKRNASWPSVTLRAVNGIEVEYVAGYGDAEDVPEEFKHGIKLLVGHWYTNRESIDLDAARGGIVEVPFAASALFGAHKVFLP